MIPKMELFESSNGKVFVVVQIEGGYELHRVRLEYADRFKRKYEAVNAIHPRATASAQH